MQVQFISNGKHGEHIDFKSGKEGLNFTYSISLSWCSDNKEWANLKNSILNTYDYYIADGGKIDHIIYDRYIDYDSSSKTLELYSGVSGSGGGIKIQMDPTTDIYKDMMNVIDDVIEHEFEDKTNN